MRRLYALRAHTKVSGSTLLAAARTGRRARLVELDPRYCDVIRKRWTEFALAARIDPGVGALE